MVGWSQRNLWLFGQYRPTGHQDIRHIRLKEFPSLSRDAPTNCHDLLRALCQKTWKMYPRFWTRHSALFQRFRVRVSNRDVSTSWVSNLQVAWIRFDNAHSFRFYPPSPVFGDEKRIRSHVTRYSYVTKLVRGGSLFEMLEWSWERDAYQPNCSQNLSVQLRGRNFNAALLDVYKHGLFNLLPFLIKKTTQKELFKRSP